jgi:uncharacterized protein YukE
MIVFDYNKAMAQVRALRAVAADMRKSQTLDSAVDGARAAWQGGTAEQFQQKCRALLALILREAKAVEQVADSLAHTAKVIDDAEREAARILTAGLVK